MIPWYESKKYDETCLFLFWYDKINVYSPCMSHDRIDNIVFFHSFNNVNCHCYYMSRKKKEKEKNIRKNKKERKRRIENDSTNQCIWESERERLRAWVYVHTSVNEWNRVLENGGKGDGGNRREKRNFAYKGLTIQKKKKEKKKKKLFSWQWQGVNAHIKEKEMLTI